MRRILRILSTKPVLIALMVGSLLGATANLALAATLYSSWYSYGPVLGYNYKNQAQITTDAGPLQASTMVQANTSVPGGYMGAQAQLFKSGSLCAATGWKYDDEAGDVGYQIFTTTGACGSGNYYSQGASAAYDGSGYYEYGTWQSPTYSY